MRLLPRRLILEAARGGALAGLRRLARNLAGHLGWIAVAHGWSSPQHLGAILAVPPGESHRAWANMLARARWLDGGSRPGWLNAVSVDPAIARHGTPSTPNLFKRSPNAADLTPLGPPVVIVTPAGWAAIRRDPKRAFERLAAFARRHPGAEAVQVHDEHSLPAPVLLTRLIAAAQSLGAPVSPAVVDRNDPPREQDASFDAHAAGDPDRSSARQTDQVDPNGAAGSEITAKAAPLGGDDGSIHEGNANPEGHHTVHRTFDAPASDQRNSLKADKQDDLDPAQERFTPPGAQSPDTDTPCALDEQPSPL